MRILSFNINLKGWARYGAAIVFLFVSVAVFASEYSTYRKDAHKVVKDIPLAGADYIVSDSMAIDTEYTLDDVIDFMDRFNHPFEISELAMMYQACQYAGINWLYFATKVQLESSLITNAERLTGKRLAQRKRWLLGYDMYRTILGGYKPGGGFVRQVEGAARCLRKHIDDYRKGVSVRINLGRHKVYPANAASYALYQYTPFWGVTIENGAVCHGNQTFRPTYLYFQRYWKTEKERNRGIVAARTGIEKLFSEIKEKLLTMLLV